MEPITPKQLSRPIPTLEDKIQRTINLFNRIMDRANKDVSAYLPKKQTDFAEIMQKFELTVSESEKLLQELRSRNLNRILLEIQYNYILSEILPNLTDMEEKKQLYALSMVEADAKLTYLLSTIEESKYLIDDIAVLREKHPNFEAVKKYIRRVWPKDREGLNKAYNDLNKDKIVKLASYVTSETYESKFSKSTVLNFSKGKYKLADTQAQIVVYNFFRNPDVAILKKLWNTSETVQVFKAQYDYIAINQKLYIPRAQVPHGVRVDLYQPEQEKICVRMLCDKSVKFRYQEPANMCCVPRPKSDFYEQIIIHFHGGSFVALTSRTSQTFTRRWATNFQIPILSVDYRLAPENTFPSALQDCYSVYLFIVNNISSHMNIKPKRIILAGDSSGGNLVMSLTGLILKNNIRPPDALFLAYPQGDLRQVFSPSRVNALDDIEFFPIVMEACHQAYCKNQYDNPWVSPVLLTEKNVSREAEDDTRWPLAWPPTRIVVGDKDPYFDDSLRLLELMVGSRVDCQMTIFEELGHDFLHLDTQISQCQGAVRESERVLESLLDEEEDD